MPWMPGSSEQRICALWSLNLIQINLFLGAAKQQAPDCLWQLTSVNYTSSTFICQGTLYWALTQGSGGWRQQKYILMAWHPLYRVNFLVTNLDLMVLTMPCILKSLSTALPKEEGTPGLLSLQILKIFTEIQGDSLGNQELWLGQQIGVTWIMTLPVWFGDYLLSYTNHSVLSHFSFWMGLKTKGVPACLTDVDWRYWGEKMDVYGSQPSLQKLGSGGQEQEAVPTLPTLNWWCWALSPGPSPLPFLNTAWIPFVKRKEWEGTDYNLC